MAEAPIGKVTHYFSKISVAIVELSQPLEVGQKIHFKGHTTDFEETVQALQLEHEEIERGEPGQQVGTKVSDRVREGDEVFLVTEEEAAG